MSQERYEVLGKLAEGGLGSVFKAYDRNLRREVALKRVRADSPEQAEQQAEKLFEEARTISTLQHPHIVTVFDVGKDNEGAYLVMELLKGETLEDIIERGALNENDFRELVSQSLEGMVAAHSTGLIHLDIKPQNFMVIWLPSGKFQIKILDFGLATIAHAPTLQETDEEGAVMGSIYFMAPEQFERSPVDARTDLYSLGCVYYFALTQHYPFQGETGPEVMASHMYHSYIPLAQLRPDLPTFVHEWVEWMINRLPDHRPESAAQAYEVFVAGAFAAPPQIEAPGTVTSPLRPTAPRPTRPVPGMPRPGTQSQPLANRPVPKPIARPVNIAAAAAPKHLKPQKKVPKWITVGIPIFIIAIALAIFGWQWLTQKQHDDRLRQLNEQMPAPTGGVYDVELLLSYFDKDKESSDEAAKVLAALRGADSGNGLIAAWVPRLQTAWGQKNIADVIAQRRIGEAYDSLVSLLGRAKDPAARGAIWKALGEIADPSSIGDLIQKMHGGTPDELHDAESALVEISRRDPDPAHRGLDIMQAYRAGSGSDDEQSELIRALCRIGNRVALPDILKALADKSTKVRYHAALGLAEWPTAEPLEGLGKMLATEKDSATRLNAINTIGILASMAGDLPQEEIAKSLINAFNAASKDARAQQQILVALSHVTDPSVVTFFDQLSNKDPKRRGQLQGYMKAISTALGRMVTLGDAATPLTPSQAFLTPGPLLVKDGVITNWFGALDQVGWLIKIDKPGDYEVQLTQGSASTPPGRFLFTIGREEFTRTVEITSPGAFRTASAGHAKFAKSGIFRIWIRPLSIPEGGQLMHLKEGTITRIGD
jgi:serine/threonine protein kinase/HEAT repeat protein